LIQADPGRCWVIRTPTVPVQEYRDGYVWLRAHPHGYLLKAFRAPALSVVGEKHLVLFFSSAGREILRTEGERVFADRAVALIKFGTRNPHYFLLEKGK